MCSRSVGACRVAIALRCNVAAEGPVFAAFAARAARANVGEAAFFARFFRFSSDCPPYFDVSRSTGRFVVDIDEVVFGRLRRDRNGAFRRIAGDDDAFTRWASDRHGPFQEAAWLCVAIRCQQEFAAICRYRYELAKCGATADFGMQSEGMDRPVPTFAHFCRHCCAAFAGSGAPGEFHGRTKLMTPPLTPNSLGRSST